MRHTELTMGRTFALIFHDGDDFLSELDRFCREAGIRQAIIPTFLGGFRKVGLVGTQGPLQNPDRPVWEETVLETVEALGAGTLARKPDDDDSVSLHIHVAVGRKDAHAAGSVSHLKWAEVQFIQEMYLQEVISPHLRRPVCDDVPTLTFGEPED
ncbi:PPC domain-containing DNA-binding protein [Streptomyces aureocirculatus]|uniref:PPC domain-containing DNA-binding protein n=1 Tax=Streptomyces aureocirculatus TaxID=67275 RepID=UPI0004CA721A|nr:DUF296 domain-containing protein [Streptomyces aureocirculatus]